MWGEMARVVRHFGGSEMEIWCSKSFLEYAKVISKRTPGNGIYSFNWPFLVARQDFQWW